MEEARFSAKASKEDCDVSIIKIEPDVVYLRFGGGTLADLFNICYKDMKCKKNFPHKEKVSQELQVLEWM